MAIAGPNTDPYLIVFANEQLFEGTRPLITETLGRTGILRVCYDEGQSYINHTNADIPRDVSTPLDFHPLDHINNASGLITSVGAPEMGALDMHLAAWLRVEARAHDVPMLTIIPTERTDDDYLLQRCIDRHMGSPNQFSIERNVMLPVPMGAIEEATLVAWLRNPVLKRMQTQRAAD